VVVLQAYRLPLPLVVQASRLHGEGVVNRRWRRVLVAGVLVAAAACAARRDAPAGDAAPAPARGGQSWPMFGGTVRRNMVNSFARDLPPTWSVKKGQEANVKWTARLGSYAYGGPVVAGGRVFVSTNNDSPRDPAITGDKGVLMCFRAADGEFLWQGAHDKLPDADANDYPKVGIVSTPAVEGDRLWYVNNRCEVVCSDARGDEAAKKEKVLWTYDMIKELGVFPCQASTCSPLVLGDLVFLVTGNGVNVGDQHKLPAPKAPSFIALDKNTGKLAWKDSSPGDKIMEGQWSNPVAAQVKGQWQVIFPGGDGWLYAFEPKGGKLVWKFDCNPKKSVYKPGGRGDRSYFVATPVVCEDKLYIGVGNQPEDGDGVGHLWCIDVAKEPKNAEKDLSPVGDNFDPKAEVNKDSGLVWHHGGPVMPKPDDGGREYVFGRTVSTCSVHDGLCYAAELAGFLQCLDAKTGKKYWEYDFKDNTWCSPCWIDGQVYVGTEGGDLYVFTPGKELKEPKKITMEGALKLPPVAVDGLLYINTGTRLYAVAGK
jgi:outer membrane protein assembly factor BamB